MDQQRIEKFIAERRYVLYLSCVAAFIFSALLLALISGGAYSAGARFILLVLSVLVFAVVFGLWFGIKMLNKRLARREPGFLGLFSPAVVTALLFLIFFVAAIILRDIMYMLGIGAVLGVLLAQLLLINSYIKKSPKGRDT